MSTAEPLSPADPAAPVRAVLLSGVRHAAEYARLLTERDDIAVHALWEDRAAPGWMREDSRRVAEQHGLRYLESDSPPGADEFDLAVVCSEPVRHAELATTAVASGLDVLVDKPVATDHASALALADLVRATGRTATVVSRLGTPAVRRARTAIDAGRLGLPRHVDVEFLASGAHFATSVERPELVVDTELSGGGEIMNFLGYAVDVVRHLTGCEVREIHCEASTLFSAVHREAGVEDVAVASLGLEHGVTATVTVGRVPSAPSPGPNASTLRILGSHGHLLLDDERPALRHFAADGSAGSIPVGGGVVAAAFRWTVDDLLRARRTGEPPQYTLADAAAAIAVIEAAYRSAGAGQPQRVAPPTLG